MSDNRRFYKNKSVYWL